MAPKNEKVSSVEKAMDILIALGNTNDKTIRELSEYLDITRSSTHRILQTLEMKGMVFKNPVTEKYSLGLKILELSVVIKEGNIIRDMATKHMRDLSEKLEDTLQLAIHENDEIIIIDIVEGSSDLRIFSRPGQTYPVTYGNFGKIFLSSMEDEIVNRLLKNSGLYIDEETFKKEIEQVREEGISVGMDTPIKGAVSMAVPILNSVGDTVASLSVVCVKTEDKLINMDNIKKQLIECGKKISADLGH